MKRPYLAVYDYGQGGIWVVMNARSAEEITNRYPELTVFEELPPFISKERYSEIASKRTLDVDDEQPSWFIELLKQ